MEETESAFSFSRLVRFSAFLETFRVELSLMQSQRTRDVETVEYGALSQQKHTVASWTELRRQVWRFEK